jgi:hypothetical protein
MVIPPMQQTLRASGWSAIDNGFRAGRFSAVLFMLSECRHSHELQSKADNQRNPAIP